MERNFMKKENGNANDENVSIESKAKCKKCGCSLYARDSIDAGYCTSCASHDNDARKAWEDKGLATFCSECGTMLIANESIESGKCSACINMHT